MTHLNMVVAFLSIQGKKDQHAGRGGDLVKKSIVCVVKLALEVLVNKNDLLYQHDFLLEFTL